MKYFITRQADRDLDAIWNRIANDNGERTANRVEQEFYDAIDLLADNPLAGHTRPDVKNPRYRFWNVYKFVTAYRTDLRPLTIARVLHGARKFQTLFRSM